MATREVHPAAALFPKLPEDEMQSLVQSIKSDGLQIPIMLDSEGRILDGRNRLTACKRVGVTPRFKTYRGDDPIGQVIRANLLRRQLSPGQSALLAAKLLPLYEDEAKDRMLSGQRSDPRAELPKGRAREHVAKMLDTSGRAVGQAKRVLEHSPGLADKC
jgi:hypothetical protein